MLCARTVKQHALEVGFDLVGVSSASALKDLEFLPEWLRRGFGGEMRYLADSRREDPRRILPSVKSVICVALIYNTSYPYSADAPAKSQPGGAGGGPLPNGWISRYAWGRDYHKTMRVKLEQLRAAVEKLSPGAETRVYVDTGPIVERAFARFSGMGWMGKNTCLINERTGSWFFLGVLLTSLELQPDLPAPDRCGSCTRCLEACPTGALVEPYVMDASRCIAYFNIELKGAIPEEFRTAIGRNMFGCDICQDVCPWNSRSLPGSIIEVAKLNSQTRRTAATQAPEFQPLIVALQANSAPTERADEGDPVASRSSTRPFSLFDPPLESLAAITEEDFKRIFATSPIKRVKYPGWLRNLCVVMGNSGDRRFISWLKAVAHHSDAMVREHAEWALHKLQTEE